MWAKTLLDNDGNSLKCDVENGGDNQRAQLLVPVHNLNRARQALLDYKESISPFSVRENHFTERVTQAHPEEIYVPTAAAHHNLDLIKGLSPTTTWANAPASIRQPPTTATSPTYRPPTIDKKGKQSIAPSQRPVHDPPPCIRQHNENPLRTDHTQQSLADTNTTSSLMTKSLATHQRFQDLENAIRQQILDTRAHQAEFLTVNKRFDELEGRVLTTMTLCRDTSENVLELRKETNENILGMRQEATAQAIEFRTAFATMTRMIDSLARINATDEDSDSSEPRTQSDNMSVQSLDTAKHGTSPRKKKGKRRRHQILLDSIVKNHHPKHDQDPSARDQPGSTPDDGEI
jgi:hypothetical protein